ncbi:hypothetical protein [Lysinibacillus sphaericus]|uniref:hypothetical protein n=1 Tax=Lysinibacillus sphaericus TaxID=1421 RepID=UPI00055C60CA|nr:hypothetical protein [Lysinibacillus sphaericus]
MKKYLASFIVLFVTGVIFNINSASANVNNENISKKNIELREWVDKDGEVYFTTDAPLENDKDAEYIQSLLLNNFNHPINGIQNDSIQPASENSKSYWTRNSITNTDSLGKVLWKTSGYSEKAMLAPVTADKMYVDNGSVTVTYTGSGKADKIVSGYSYEFNGITASISAYPTLSTSSQIVSWISQPVSDVTSLSYTSRWAYATSRVHLSNVELNVYGDVYKGSKIYNPRGYEKIYWLSN